MSIVLFPGATCDEANDIMTGITYEIEPTGEMDANNHWFAVSLKEGVVTNGLEVTVSVADLENEVFALRQVADCGDTAGVVTTLAQGRQDPKEDSVEFTLAASGGQTIRFALTDGPVETYFISVSLVDE